MKIIACIFVFIMAFMVSISVLYVCLVLLPLAIIGLVFRNTKDNIIKSYIKIAGMSAIALSPLLAILIIAYDLI